MTGVMIVPGACAPTAAAGTPDRARIGVNTLCGAISWAGYGLNGHLGLKKRSSCVLASAQQEGAGKPRPLCGCCEAGGRKQMEAPYRLLAADQFVESSCYVHLTLQPLNTTMTVTLFALFPASVAPGLQSLQQLLPPAALPSDLCQIGTFSQRGLSVQCLAPNDAHLRSGQARHGL